VKSTNAKYVIDKENLEDTLDAAVFKVRKPPNKNEQPEDW
jgi:hypothetical protein